MKFLNEVLSDKGLCPMTHDIRGDVDIFLLDGALWKARAGFVKSQWFKVKNRNIQVARIEEVKEKAEHG